MGIKSEDIDVVILCGGRGSRLKSICNNCPKPMVKVNRKPFLDILINYIAKFGFKRFILSVGYKGNMIEKYYKEKKNINLEILISKEKEPLGTAGAIKNAENLIKSNIFLVANGDGLCYTDLSKFINFHLNKKGLISILSVNIAEPNDYGRIGLDGACRVTKFDEKVKNDSKMLISTGIYLFNKAIFSLIEANKKVSLEHDIFPKNINKKIYSYRTDDLFVDIGTPERYNKAKHLLKK